MSSAKKLIRLLLVDDHEVVRVGLRAVLHNNQGIAVVGEAASKAAAVRAVKRLKPDIVLMDVRLPDGSGVEASREILARHPTTRFIFLTSYANDDSGLAAVRAGAHGYVIKDIDSALLVRSILGVSMANRFSIRSLPGGRGVEVLGPLKPARRGNNLLLLRKSASWH